MEVLPPRKLVKIRTFQDDFSRAQKQTGATVTPRPEPTASAPEKKPDPESPLVASPTAARTKPAAHRRAPVKTPSFDDVVNKPRPTTPVPPVIPADDLQEHLQTIAAPSTESRLTAAPSTFDASAGMHDDGEEGTIITDQKNDRFHLLPAIFQSIVAWMISIQERIQGPQEPVRTVASADERKAILQKAATKSALAPQDDFDSVLKQRPAIDPASLKEATTVTIAEEVEAAEPTWSATDEAVAEPVPGPLPEAAPAAVSGYDSWEPEAKIATPPEATAEPEVTSSEPPAPEREAAATETGPSLLVPGVPPATTPAPEPTPGRLTIATPEPVMEAAAPEPLPAPLPAPATASTIGGRGYLVKFGVVTFVAIVLGVTVSFVLFGENDPGVMIADSTTGGTLIRADASIPVALTNSTDGFMQNLLAVAPQSTTVSTFYPTVAEGGTTRAATTIETLAVLNPRTPSSFTRAIESIAFGVHQGVDPFILLKTNSFDTALSGMLNWEENMSSDLAPFFGPPVSGTYDARARTSNQVVAAFFVDEVIANVDARVLRNEQQEERLIYSFIDRNTILITTSRPALEILAEASK